MISPMKGRALINSGSTLVPSPGNLGLGLGQLVSSGSGFP